MPASRIYKLTNPVSDDLISPVLTNISVAFQQTQDEYIASRVFPVVPVSKQTGRYYVWPSADWFRDAMQRRGDSEESAGDGFTLSNDSYYCDVWALHKDIGSQARANLENEIGLSRATTLWLTGRAMLRQEKQWVTDYFTTGVWGTDFTPANLWSDYTLSTPIEDIEAARRAIKIATGFRPNTLVLGYDVFTKLKNHPDVIDRFKYTTAETITESLLARLFEIDRIFVAGVVENTANEGLAATMQFTQGKHALLAYAATAPALEAPSAGYTFHWTGDENNVSQGLGTTVGVRNFYMPEKKADRYEIEIAFDHKVVSPSLGYFFNTVVA